MFNFFNKKKSEEAVKIVRNTIIDSSALTRNYEETVKHSVQQYMDTIQPDANVNDPWHGCKG
jgi:hypothetical protein